MTPSGVFLYVSENESGTIAVFRLGVDGVPSPVQTIDLGGFVMPMAVSRDRRFLYAALRNLPYTIVTLAIDPFNGTLAERGRVPATESTVYMTVDGSGRFLVTACNPPDKVRRTGILSIYPIGNMGTVQGPPLAIRTPPKLHSVLADPANRFLIAPSCDGDALLRFAFDATRGMASSDGLAPVVTMPKAGPRHMRFHPSGRFLYVIHEYDASIVVYRYVPETGSLYEIQTASALGGLDPDANNWRAADLAFSPSGRWMFASVRETPAIAVHAVDPNTGMIEYCSSAEASIEPRAIGVHPSGRWIYSTGMMSRCLNQFSFEENSGELVRLPDIETGDGPNWIEIVSLP